METPPVVRTPESAEGSNPAPRALVIDADPTRGATLQGGLSNRGFVVERLEDLDAALDTLKTTYPDLLVVVGAQRGFVGLPSRVRAVCSRALCPVIVSVLDAESTARPMADAGADVVMGDVLFSEGFEDISARVQSSLWGRDPETTQELVEMLGDATVAELSQQLIVSASAVRAMAGEVVQRRADCARAVHTLAGGASALGLFGLAKACARVEVATKLGAPDERMQIWSSFTPYLDRIITSLDNTDPNVSPSM